MRSENSFIPEQALRAGRQGRKKTGFGKNGYQDGLGINQYSLLIDYTIDLPKLLYPERKKKLSVVGFW